MTSELLLRSRQFSAFLSGSRVHVPLMWPPQQAVGRTLKRQAASLLLLGTTFPSMNVDVWIPPVVAAVIVLCRLQASARANRPILATAPGRLIAVLMVAPTIIIESGTDWPAIIASISTGVAAVAGIFGTVWQSRRGWNRDDKRVRLADKRSIYADCLTTFNAAARAATSEHVARQRVDRARKRVKMLADDAEILIEEDELNIASEEYVISVRESIDAKLSCLTAANILYLIAPDSVSVLAKNMLDEIGDYPKKGSPKPEASLGDAMTYLIVAMRTDLDESPVIAPVGRKNM
jgi:hypothetical protein